MVTDAALGHPERLRRTAKTQLPRGLDKHADGIERQYRFVWLVISFTHC